MNQLPPATTRYVEVLATSDIGPRLRRVTVGGADLDGFRPLPGQDVVVHLTDAAGSGVRRRYTIRNLDPVASCFDLDVVIHGHGPGSTWGSTAQVGDSVEIFGPRGKVLMSGAAWQLFVGDESALPAIGEMLPALPATVAAVALVEVEDAGDEQLLSGAGNLDLRWLHRRGAAPGGVDAVMAALSAVESSSPDRHAYVFGESRVVKAVRDELARRGFRPDQISAKGYWNTFAGNTRGEGTRHAP